MSLEEPALRVTFNGIVGVKVEFSGGVATCEQVRVAQLSAAVV